MADFYGDDNPNDLRGTDAADTLYGAGGNDRLTAYHGYDTLYGGAGDDLLIAYDDGGNNLFFGGDGIDTVDYSGAGRSSGGATVWIDSRYYGGPGAAHGDRIYQDVENIIGTEYDDTLTGSAGDNVLTGDGQSGSGDDELRGAGGDDTLLGVRGDDRLYGDTGADVLGGGDGEDLMRGGDGDDLMVGGSGADILIGGAGIDTAYWHDSTVGVTVSIGDFCTGGEAEGDLVAPDVENLVGSSYADILTGSDAANLLTGANAAWLTDVGDILSGLGGNDTLQGYDGNDVLRGGTGADRLDGGRGIDTASYFTSSTGVVVNLAAGTGRGGEAEGDTLTGIDVVSGSQGNDSIVGDTYANVLQGWGGSDVLAGAGGKDTLTGGAGADRFVYGSAAQSVVGANADRITDFSHAQGDRIDLSAIDASTAAAGNQAFRFIGTGLYTRHAGELRYAFNGADTTIAGDLNGDGVSDVHIVLAGRVVLQAGDFVL
ncbi:calcium-binding protein [Inquilinus limosus]|uniref:Uncharacterized protein n=1 Tax=Inquilinus limosus TaxID=171674 RepID=A0A211ZS43_9PROT|nr:calcium-binding protein [Inquilinus limosus]OWJ68101.1 hypothetical protein BWR60_06580 [Inquilinus limosus]